MKKIIAVFTILTIILGMFLFVNKTYAAEKAIDDTTESKLVEIKETQTKSLEDYKEKYGSDAYGLVAFILNKVRIYSIPFCFFKIFHVDSTNMFQICIVKCSNRSVWNKLQQAKRIHF